MAARRRLVGPGTVCIGSRVVARSRSGVEQVAYRRTASVVQVGAGRTTVVAAVAGVVVPGVGWPATGLRHLQRRTEQGQTLGQVVGS